MSTVTVPQVNPNDEITALSVNQGPNAIAAVLNGNIDDANISTISGSKVTAGTLPASASDVSSNPETRESETTGDLVASGLIWSATTGLGATMTSGVAYVSGKRLVVPAVASNTFTASRDTYVYVDNTGSIQYNPQTNGAVQPATPTNNQLIAKIITNASVVTNISDLRATGIGDVWRTWTPIWTNLTTGNGVLSYAKFKQTGKSVNFRLHFVLGSTSSVSGVITFTLPVALNSDLASFNNRGIVSALEMRDNSAGTSVFGQITINNTQTVVLQNYATSGTAITMASTSGTNPYTWAVGDIISCSGMYEAA